MYRNLRLYLPLCLLLALLLTACGGDDPFEQVKQLPDGAALRGQAVALPQGEPAPGFGQLDVYATVASYIETLCEKRAQVDGSFGGLGYDGERVYLYATDTGEAALEQYFDVLYEPYAGRAGNYSPTALVPCDYSLRALHETWQAVTAASFDWLYEAQLCVPANRLALYVSRWDGAAREALQALISDPAQCLIVQGEPPAHELTVTQYPDCDAPQTEQEQAAADYRQFCETVGFDASFSEEQRDEIFAQQLQLRTALCNAALFFPEGSEEARLLGQPWPLRVLGATGIVVTQEEEPLGAMLPAVYPWQEAYTEALAFACAGFPNVQVCAMPPSPVIPLPLLPEEN